MIESRHKKDLDIIEERHKNEVGYMTTSFTSMNMQLRNELDMAKKELDDVKAALTWTKQELNDQQESAKIDLKTIKGFTKTVERLTIQDDDTNKQIDGTNIVLVLMGDLDEVTL
mmetsp:Transcript_8781/g.22087  ORF Transcript_8781/g.22087 Transcript_8781/m.22087 type:complete len:114 (-) Transcript_8781:205-546(-)